MLTEKENNILITIIYEKVEDLCSKINSSTNKEETEILKNVLKDLNDIKIKLTC